MPPIPLDAVDRSTLASEPEVTAPAAPAKVTKDAASPMPVAQRQRHKNLWFEDGNIILATEDVIFRVYRGILAEQSAIFRDLFSIPQPAVGSDEDVMDGIPVIPLHDNSRDLECLLSALYDCSFYGPKNELESNYTIITIHTYAAVLRLSNKYEIQTLREQAIRQLSILYPDTLEAFDRIMSKPRFVDYEDDWGVIMAAREADAGQLIPAAFYWIAAGWKERNILYVLNHCSLDLVSVDMRKILEARENLRHALRKDIGAALYTQSTCTMRPLCDGAKSAYLRDGAWSAWNETADALNPGILAEFQSGLNARCQTCQGTILYRANVRRRELWENLPSYFGLEKWESLRAMAVRSTVEG